MTEKEKLEEIAAVLNKQVETLDSEVEKGINDKKMEDDLRRISERCEIDYKLIKRKIRKIDKGEATQEDYKMIKAILEDNKLAEYVEEQL